MNSSSDDTMELLIESELNILRREATEVPLPESKVRAEEESKPATSVPKTARWSFARSNLLHKKVS
jgi:hypothetical protein